MKGAIMDSNLLKYLAFVRTVETGSFTRAAELLHYSQSGISCMIRDLETECGLSLLERSRAGVHLTSEEWRCCRRRGSFARNMRASVQKWTNRPICAVVSSASARFQVSRRTGSRASSARFRPIIRTSIMSCCSAITPRSRRGSEGRVDCGFLRLPVRGALETMFLEEDRLLAIRPLDVPATRRIGFAVRSFDRAPLAVRRFLDYLPCRSEET